MRWLDRLRSRCDAFLHGQARERAMDEEMRFHLEMETKRNLERGLAPAEARRAAMLDFGGVERVKEECRDAWGVRFLETLLQDVRYGLRGLRASPGFATAVIVTFALGIGANTAIFSVVNAVLLRPLPYEHSERTVLIRASAPGTGSADVGFSPLEVRDFREQARSLDGLVEYHSMNFTLLGGSEPLRVQTGVVSWNFFGVLAVKPILGRSFRPADEQPGADAVLLLSHEFWTNRLGADPHVVGRAFEMNDRVHTVIGVLPSLPRYPDANDVFMPTSACPFRSRPSTVENRQARMVNLFARVGEGVSLEQARSEVKTIAERLIGAYPDAYPKEAGYRADLLPLREEMVKAGRPTFLMLLATVALVLLIACFNVANLIIARLVTRERELALRAALGAGRGRLVRQLLTETTLLALAGGLLGLVLATTTLGLLTSFAGRFTARASEVRVDAVVLAFTFLLSLLTGLVAGALPGLPPWTRLAQMLQEGARATLGKGRSRLRASLVAGELALSLVLLVGAALMLRSFAKLLDVDPGFRTENVLAVDLDLNWSHYMTPEHGRDRRRLTEAFHQPLLERLRELPGVVSVGTSWTVPLNSAFNNSGTFLIEGRTAEGQPPPRADVHSASPDFFTAIGVPVLRGRAFDSHDRSDAAGVVLVNESLARRNWGGRDPVGARISTDDGHTWVTVVGVVGNVRHGGLDRPPSDVIYLPFLQYPAFTSTYFVRAMTEPRALSRQVREAVRGLDAQAAIASVRSLEQVRSESLASPRLTAVLLGLFAFAALTIAATGLFGLVAFTVSQRTHEIGIRMALGADPRRVVRLLLRQCLRPVATGLALGLVGALALGRLVSGLLFGVTPTDATCFLSSALLLATVGILACLLPARRATAIDPQLALRSL